jgi:hypothetical protein
MVELIIFNGVTMAAGWPERIEEAQQETEYEIRGAFYHRIKHGEEIRLGPAGACRDCAVLRGQYHVPGCDKERCPRCQGQAIGCECTDHEVDGPLAGPES